MSNKKPLVYIEKYDSDTEDESDNLCTNIVDLFQEQVIETNKSTLSIKLTSLYKLFPIFMDEDKSIEYLFEKKVLQIMNICAHCKKDVYYYKDKKRYRCVNYKCRKSFSIFKNSIFYKAKLPINKILHIVYEFLKKTPRDSVVTSLDLTPVTVTYYFKLIREAISKYTVLNVQNDMIGGENSIVELDESLFCRRKYHKGHRVKGVWVLRGIDRGTKNIFTIPVENRNKETLLKNIKKFVKPGTTIYTDCWKGYFDLKKSNNYKHHTVNHSKHFKDPESGIHTNHIEGTWNGLKMNIRPQHRTKKYIYNSLLECQWRKKYRKDNIWIEVLRILQSNRN